MGRAAAAGLAAAALLAGASRAGSPPDPDALLPFSTCLGGAGDEAATALALGPDGVLWIAATIFGGTFPGEPPDTYTGNAGDVLVIRFDPLARSVLSVLRVGGRGSDRTVALAVDPAGNAYLAGTTGSADFPHSPGLPGPPADEYSGEDVFLVRLAPDGSGVAWSTVLGGWDTDRCTGLTLTAAGDPVVVGETWSVDFPLVTPFRSTVEGGSDAFVASVRADGTSVRFSTLLGGLAQDLADSVSLGLDGNLLVSGRTWSAGFAPGSTLFGTAGEFEGFLVEMPPSGDTVLRGARVGTTTIRGVLPEAPGSLVLFGNTSDAAFPAPPLPGATTRAEDAFLLRLDAEDWSPGAGSRLAGSGVGSRAAAARSPDGTLWLAGATSDQALDLPGAPRPLPASEPDAFVAAFDPTEFSLEFGTYLGGTSWEAFGGIVADPSGGAWCAGGTRSAGFPAVAPLKSRAPYEGDEDLFLCRVLPGDPAGRPGDPTGLDVDVDIDRNLASLAWEDGSSNEEGFAVFRRGDAGFERVAVLPPGTTAWDDDTAPAGRVFFWAVQAFNGAGGSSPTPAKSAMLPASAELALESGAFRFYPDWFDGTSRLRLRGMLRPRGLPSRPIPDPALHGAELLLHDSNGDFPLLSIAPGDPGWEADGDGWLWRQGYSRLRVDPATGEFALGVRGYGWILWPGEVTGIRLTLGTEAGFADLRWRKSGPRRSRLAR